MRSTPSSGSSLTSGSQATSGSSLAAGILFAVLFLASAGAAQISGTNQAIGWSVVQTGAARVGEIHIQDIDNLCQTATRRCASAGQPTNNLFAGGTAYDPRHQSVWISNGTTIEEIDLKTCRSICTLKVPLLNSKAVVSGLAISDRTRRLYHLETTSGYMGIQAYDITKCPPRAFPGGCKRTFQNSQSVAAGLAYDEVNDLLYFTESFPAFVGFISTLHVAKASSPCTFSKISMSSCSTAARAWGMVTGVGYDACTKRIYATDGRMTLTGTVTDITKGQVNWQGCCPKRSQGDYRGLAVVPGWVQKSVGKSCLGSPCASCTSMAAGLAGGDPSLGNRSFGAQLLKAPRGGFALLFLGGGGCQPGLQFPFLCGPFHPSLTAPLIISPAVPITGAAACQGSAVMTLGIPVQRGLCGGKICLQWLVLCPTSAGTGLGLSNAVEFNVTGS